MTGGIRTKPATKAYCEGWDRIFLRPKRLAYVREVLAKRPKLFVPVPTYLVGEKIKIGVRPSRKTPRPSPPLVVEVLGVDATGCTFRSPTGDPGIVFWVNVLDVLEA